MFCRLRLRASAWGRVTLTSPAQSLKSYPGGLSTLSRVVMAKCMRHGMFSTGRKDDTSEEIAEDCHATPQPRVLESSQRCWTNFLLRRWDLLRFVWRGRLRAIVKDVDFALGTTIDPEVSPASRRLQVLPPCRSTQLAVMLGTLPAGVLMCISLPDMHPAVQSFPWVEVSACHRATGGSHTIGRLTG